MEPSQSYHIFNHVNGTENIFREEENYRFFLRQYVKYLGEVVDTHAYCLMPNHFHLLVGVRGKADLTKLFQSSKLWKSWSLNNSPIFSATILNLLIRNIKEKEVCLSKILKENQF